MNLNIIMGGYGEGGKVGGRYWEPITEIQNNHKNYAVDIHFCHK